MKTALSKKRIKAYQEMSARFKGSGNPFYGETHTESARKKMSERQRSKGSAHHNWRGGIKIHSDGYLFNRQANKYVHRLVMEEKLGRELLPTEHVHHINGNKKDNRVENLEIHSNSEHRKIEAAQARRDSYGRFA